MSISAKIIQEQPGIVKIICSHDPYDTFFEVRSGADSTIIINKLTPNAVFLLDHWLELNKLIKRAIKLAKKTAPTEEEIQAIRKSWDQPK